MFSKLSHDGFLLYRYQGDRSLLDPWVQQLNSHFPWIIPILVHHNPYFSFVQRWLLDLIISFCSPRDGLLCLLLPSVKSSSVNSSNFFGELLCRALDVYPRESIIYNPYLRFLLELPLDSILLNITPELSSNISKAQKQHLVLANAFFRLSPLSDISTIRKPYHVFVNHRNTIITFFRILNNQQSFLQSFFLKYSQFLPRRPSPIFHSSDINSNYVSNFIFPKPFQLISSYQFRSIFLPSFLTNTLSSPSYKVSGSLLQWRFIPLCPLFVRNLRSPNAPSISLPCLPNIPPTKRLTFF